jgi:hypothetical protein
MNKIQPTISSILNITALAYRSICYLFLAVLKGPCFSQRQEVGYCILGVNSNTWGVEPGGGKGGGGALIPFNVVKFLSRV